MDADALRMLADLGITRRDAVSAPEEIPKGRQLREDPREQAAAARAFEKRRAGCGHDGNGVEGERAARLKAWNTETTFEVDEVTGQLENRWSGQGHRAGLNRQRLNNDAWEEMDARFGEERRMYIQEKGGKAGGFARERAPRSGQEKFLELLEGGAKKGGRVRAPSSRRFGTVRFKPGTTRAEAGVAAAPPVNNPGLEAAAALRRSVQNAAPPQRSRLELVAAIDNLAEDKRTQPSDPSAATLRAKWSSVDAAPEQIPRQESTTSTSAATPTDTNAATLRAKWSNIDAPPKPTQRPDIPTSTTTAPKKTKADKPLTTAVPAVENWVQAQKCRNLARWHAANGGEESERYHEKYPDRLHYLEEARIELVKETIALVKEGDEKEIAAELKAHPERKWMFESARKAKKEVEEGDLNDIDADPSFAPFVRAAQAVFTPKKSHIPAKASKSSSEDSTNSSANASGSSDTEDSAQTVASAPPPPGPGSLIATFFDVAGRLLGSHHTSLSAPVKATMSFSSRATHFDPHQLIHAIDTLAQSMMDRSNGLVGVKLADDGLWIDDEL